jgi:hypothetical protein
MQRRSDAVPEQVAGFSAYFESNAEVDAILNMLGYSFNVETLILPRYTGELNWVVSFQDRLTRLIPHVGLSSEIARREFLIAPVLMEIALRFDIRIRSEFAIDVSESLRGSLDYLVQGRESLVIIEAKQGDLSRGFKQLAAEMVAVDQWTESDTPTLYGAVTLGDAWRFGILDRQTKKLSQDINLYTVPTDLETLIRALVAMLDGESLNRDMVSA